MHYGFSIYSFWNALRRGEMTLEEVFAWAAEHGADHMEMADFVVDLRQNGMPQTVAALARQYGLTLSAYSVGSQLASSTGDRYAAELQRLQGEIDIACALGAPLIRCDLVSVMVGKDATSIEAFDALLPRMAQSAQELCAYAAERGLTVTIENHGTLLNGGDRVRRLLRAVNRPDYGCTLDIGNAVCVDEDPRVCADALLPFARRIHIKDFYIREDAYAIGAQYVDGYTINDPSVLSNGSWLTTRGGRYLRGAIIGHGDLPLRQLVEQIVASGYDGYLTIEFEGMEEARLACQLSIQNLKQLVFQSEQKEN